mmetsp:Transcript_12594/g.30981  ORF Transcript_12594/g.30981 Transcript_12594/m.30981 type:complete len:205 (-) Transcript_12594:2206-2820(-)
MHLARKSSSLPRVGNEALPVAVPFVFLPLLRNESSFESPPSSLPPFPLLPPPFLSPLLCFCGAGMSGMMRLSSSSISPSAFGEPGSSCLSASLKACTSELSCLASEGGEFLVTVAFGVATLVPATPLLFAASFFGLSSPPSTAALPRTSSALLAFDSLARYRSRIASYTFTSLATSSFLRASIIDRSARIPGRSSGERIDKALS